MLEEAKQRSALYGLSSRILLQELDDKMVKLIRKDTNILELLPNLKEWDPFFKLDISSLLNEHLNVDFVNISMLHLTPYETFYTREDGMVETGGANPVTDLYNTYNFMVDLEATL